MKTRTEEIAQAAKAAVEAALWAPSIHNTQPWSFGVSGDEISLRADPDRKLRVSDPTGRQLMISCGAALFNVRITLLALGYEPEVRRIPDPERPLLLATVRVRPGQEPGEHVRLLHGEIERRRTHRSGFTALPVPDRLIDALVAEATAEGGHMTPIRSDASARVLAALTGAAQDVQSQNRLFVLELMRWARPPGSSRRDGVPAAGYPTDPRRTYPQHFAQRDYARGHEWGMAPDERVSASTGLVALLSTAGDSREDWLRAGEALQRMLLHASAYGLSVAFHTQALEMPELREFIRRHLCSDEPPQMIMRLGFVIDESESVRRAPSEVLE
ncbi:Acg family FMN-binding oxidoreductase [Microbispora sp. CA-135349]|uniref:Acg family FMN-binding oxidoreductase n=1 Tax=Microbispora sp. CA-135349 TaxID=3239953 RepID=UPI003D92C230